MVKNEFVETKAASNFIVPKLDYCEYLKEQYLQFCRMMTQLNLFLIWSAKAKCSTIKLLMTL